jgi:hypothetical protein
MTDLVAADEPAPLPLAERDAFPTPLMKDEHDKVIVWPGGGLNVLQYTAIKMTAALAQGGIGHMLDDSDLALRGFKLAKAVVARLEANNEDDIPEED